MDRVFAHGCDDVTQQDSIGRVRPSRAQPRLGRWASRLDANNNDSIDPQFVRQVVRCNLDSQSRTNDFAVADQLRNNTIDLIHGNAPAVDNDYGRFAKGQSPYLRNPEF